MPVTESKKPPPPAMALRTYRFLRFTVVGVIAMLLLSILLEYLDAGRCLKGSMSAYYYSPVRSIFVGALCAIGLVLVALWGKTAIEEAMFNLAGLLAPVVAFVPTTNDPLCPVANPLAISREANHAAISNTMRTYLIVVALILLALVARGLYSHFVRPSPLIEDNLFAYWLPLSLAVALWGLGEWQFLVRDDEPGDASWFYQHVHFTSAIVMFVFITLGILWIGITRWCGRGRPSVPPDSFFLRRWLVHALNAFLGVPELSPKRHRGWAIGYTAQALLMLVVSVVMFVVGGSERARQSFQDTHVFWIELWMIVNVAIFWSLQTKERWKDGAPPATPVEKQKEMAAVQAEEA